MDSSLMLQATTTISLFAPNSATTSYSTAISLAAAGKVCFLSLWASLSTCSWFTLLLQWNNDKPIHFFFDLSCAFAETRVKHEDNDCCDFELWQFPFQSCAHFQVSSYICTGARHAFYRNESTKDLILQWLLRFATCWFLSKAACIFSNQFFFSQQQHQQQLQQQSHRR